MTDHGSASGSGPAPADRADGATAGPDQSGVARVLGRRDLKAALFVFAVALGLRALYVGEIVHLPEFDMPAVDAGYHDYWAWGLASGDWSPPELTENPHIESTPYFRPPLCPYFLALIYAVIGHSYVAVRVVQMVIGSLSCVLVYCVAARLFDRPTAIVAGLMAAGYWVLIYFDSELREVLLLVFLHLVLVLCLLSLRDRPGPLKALGCGVVLGLAALARPNVLLFAPVAMIWLVYVLGRRVGVRRRVFVSVCVLAGAAIAVAPATIRNAVVAHDPVLISSNGGINLYIGNNPLATGYDVRLPPPIPEFASAFDYPRIVRYVERIENQRMTHSEVSRYFARRAIEYATSNPGRTAALVLRKAALFWSGIEIVSEQDLNAARNESLVLRVLPGGFAIWLSCAVVGLFFALRSGTRRPGYRRETGFESRAAPDTTGIVLVLLFVGVYFASFLPFFVNARYRVPIIPFVIVFAGYGLVRIGRRLLERRVASAGVAVLVIAGLYVVDTTDFYNVADDGFKAKYDRASTLAAKGRLDEAIARYRDALRIRPRSAKARNNLGVVLARKGQADEAIEQYVEALRVAPDYPEAHGNLGAELLEQGDLDGAVLHCGEAVRLRPDFVPARKNLALALALQGRDAEAIEQYREALRIEPVDAVAQHNLGVLLERQGRIEDAIRHFRRALEIDPDYASARQALDAALAETRRSAGP